MARRKKKSSDAKKGPPGWTTGPQEEFLKSYLPTYFETQTSKGFDNFWKALQADWRSHWPVGSTAGEEQVTGGEEAQQLFMKKVRGAARY